jgi:hypothetical protein
MMAQRRKAKEGLERHYTLKEIAKLWHISVFTLRPLFADQPDVVRFGKGSTTRPYVSLRIPESVALRVYQENYIKKPDGQTGHDGQNDV